MECTMAGQGVRLQIANGLFLHIEDYSGSEAQECYLEWSEIGDMERKLIEKCLENQAKILELFRDRFVGQHAEVAQLYYERLARLRGLCEPMEA